MLFTERYEEGEKRNHAEETREIVDMTSGLTRASIIEAILNIGSMQ